MLNKVLVIIKRRYKEHFASREIWNSMDGEVIRYEGRRSDTAGPEVKLDIEGTVA